MNGTLFARVFGSDLLAEWHSGALVIRGVLSILIGLLFLLYPAALPVTLGILLIFNGGIALGAAFAPGVNWLFAVCYSLLMMLLGSAALSNPIPWGISFLWVLGLWMAVSAAVQLIRYFRHDREDLSRPMQLTLALLTAISGAAFFTHPLFNGLILNMVIGGTLIAFGVVAVTFGIFLAQRVP